MNTPAHHVVVMGVSGCGKSTVGKLLARRMNARFIDADALHPASNVAKMEAGTPLNDQDRKPWLEAVGQQLAEAGNRSVVVACSALKKSYRDDIRAADPTACFILLHGSRALLAARLQSRRGHFMPVSLLDSQLRTLEPLRSEEAGFGLDIAHPPDDLATEAAVRLSL